MKIYANMGGDRRFGFKTVRLSGLNLGEKAWQTHFLTGRSMLLHNLGLNT
jgi:hypothetical protein